MSANPLQDNGLPRYDWFKRIVATVIIAERSGQLVVDKNGIPKSSHGWVRKDLRREIVRVAKEFNRRKGDGK